jgi:flagellar basal-body rod protein FlgF
MQNAQLISLSRQMALQRQLDVVANNMANINTNGFKSSDLLFEDYLMPGASSTGFEGYDKDLHFTDDWSTLHNLDNGEIDQTGNTFDVALDGQGFFTVQTPTGDMYTRNGSFTLDNTGTLVDLNGNPVLTDGGPVKVASSDTGISIGVDGTISTASGGKGKLKVVEFDDPQVLAHAGENYFSAPTNVTPNGATKTKVLQGAIERSNVNGMVEMSNMIRITRAYQTISNIMQRQDEMRTMAIQRLGEVTA